MRPSKTYDYIIVLKKPSLRVIDWISQLMLLTAFVLLIYTGLTQTAMDSEGNKPYSYQVLEFVFSAIIAGWWVFCRLQQRQYKQFTIVSHS